MMDITLAEQSSTEKLAIWKESIIQKKDNRLLEVLTQRY